MACTFLCECNVARVAISPYRQSTNYKGNSTGCETLLYVLLHLARNWYIILARKKKVDYELV